MNNTIEIVTPTIQGVMDALDAWAESAPIDLVKAVRRWAVTPATCVKTKATYNGQRAVDVKADGLTQKEFTIRNAVLALEDDGTPATYLAIEANSDLSVAQIAGSVSVLLTKGMAEVHREVIDHETGKVGSVVRLTDAGRAASLRVPKDRKSTRQEAPATKEADPAPSGDGVPAWAKGVTVKQIIDQDWNLETQTLDDLEEAMQGKSPKTRLSTLWLHLPSSATDDLVQNHQTA
jgi:hypothetical protein